MKKLTTSYLDSNKTWGESLVHRKQTLLLQQFSSIFSQPSTCRFVL